MRVACDTTILISAEGANDAVRQDIVITLVALLQQGTIVIPARVLGDLCNVLVRKAGKSRVEARDIVLRWQALSSTLPATPGVLRAAIDLGIDHQLRIWDTVMLAAASRAGCRLWLSEVLQDGCTWGGSPVVSSFTEPRHWLLTGLLASGPR